MNFRFHFIGLCLCFFSSVAAQVWYLDITSGELISSVEGGERFRDSALLAVGKGNAKDLHEQLPHALDAYGIDYEYNDEGLVVYTGFVYKAWRRMKAGEDIQATLGMLLLADLFINIRGVQTRVVGSLFKNGFTKLSSMQASKLWELPAVQRGVEIEALRAGANRLPYGFPVVDVYNGATATSIKTIDLTLSSYQSSKLFYRCKNYVDKLINFQGAQRSGVIVPNAAKKELEIVIPKGSATETQWKMLDNVIDYGKLNNISVRIIEL